MYYQKILKVITNILLNYRIDAHETEKYVQFSNPSLPSAAHIYFLY